LNRLLLKENKRVLSYEAIEKRFTRYSTVSLDTILIDNPSYRSVRAPL